MPPTGAKGLNLAASDVHYLFEGLREHYVDRIYDTFIDEDEINFHQAFSVPVPCTMFLRLLGLPIDEMPMFVRWKDGIIRPPVEFGDVEAAARVLREARRPVIPGPHSENGTCVLVPSFGCTAVCGSP